MENKDLRELAVEKINLTVLNRFRNSLPLLLSIIPALGLFLEPSMTSLFMIIVTVVVVATVACMGLAKPAAASNSGERFARADCDTNFIYGVLHF